MHLTVGPDQASGRVLESTRSFRGASAAAPTVGVAGGGQLARMMAAAARRLGLKLCVLDPDAACSAADVADSVLVGAYDSLTALRTLARKSDWVTYEIERVNTGSLRCLENLGHVVAPSATVLETVQDKLLQKHFLRAHGIPTSAFQIFRPDVEREDSMPFVWKARRDGYDGRGVAVVQDAADLARLPQVPALREALVDIERELAILVARDATGALECYPVVEIIMNPERHVLDTVVAPAAIDKAIAARAREIGTEIAVGLDYVGILAVEFFVERGGKLLVNEISPRPHNAGHYTIEACAVSQFEQHLRAVAGLGLRPAGMRGAAVTFNVLGADDAYGRPRYIGFDEAAATANAHVHCYAKREVRPGRKMAHVTVLGANSGTVLSVAQELRQMMAVHGSDVGLRR